MQTPVCSSTSRPTWSSLGPTRARPVWTHVPTRASPWPPSPTATPVAAAIPSTGRPASSFSSPIATRPAPTTHPRYAATLPAQTYSNGRPSTSRRPSPTGSTTIVSSATMAASSTLAFSRPASACRSTGPLDSHQVPSTTRRALRFARPRASVLPASTTATPVRAALLSRSWLRSPAAVIWRVPARQAVSGPNAAVIRRPGLSGIAGRCTIIRLR